jgi:signal transduction histidine kinase
VSEVRENEQLTPEALSQVLAIIELGVIGFREGGEGLLFCNRKARELLDAEPDRGMVETLFRPWGGGRPRSSSSLLVGDSVQVGDRHVGFTVYDLPDGSQWIILRDVSDRLHLQRAAEGMIVANNLGHAFAGVAHELGNPINSVKMAATVLRDNLDQFSPERQREYLSEILSETLRMQEILRLMQTFLGVGSLEQVVVDLVQECQGQAAILSREVEGRGVELRCLSPGRPPAFCRVDPSALRQAVANLVTNAVEAVRETARPQIVLDAWAGARFAHLRVSDNGRGLTREQRERLFFPFSSTRAGGMGFGLIIVKKLVSGMGGTIEVFSAPDVGTTFELRFPLVPASSPPGGG